MKCSHDVTFQFTERECVINYYYFGTTSEILENPEYMFAS